MKTKIYAVFIPLILIYLSYNFYAYVVVDCWVPDEQAFFQSAISFDYGLKDFIFSENQFGYGPLYWWVLSIANHFDNFKILRLLSFGYLTFTLILIWLIGIKLRQSKIFKIYSCLFFLSYPSSWGFSKIIGPELLSLFLGIAGFYLSLSKKTNFIGYIFTGMSFGVKLNSIAIFIFTYIFQLCALYNSKGNQNYIKTTLWIMAYCFVGFIISTPVFIFNPKLVFLNIITYGNASFLINDLAYILFSHNYTWDGIINNGLFNSTINIYLFLLIFIFSLKKMYNINILLSFTIAFFFLSLQILSASNYLTWYWFPIIFLSPIIIFSFHDDKITRIFFGIVISLNFIFNYNLIYKKIENRIKHQKTLDDKVSVEAFINNFKDNNSKTDFYYFTDFGITPSPSFKTWTLFNSPYKKDTKNKSKGSSKVLFLGKRFLDFDPSWKDLVNNKLSNQIFSFKLIDEHEHIKVFQLIEKLERG
tara:strand:+ start:1873 stop:3294 length:1422 start_codon:yes stop_codon:yes gene_type:complete